MKVKKAGENIERDFKLVLQELKENPYRKFNLAFSLMSVIPLLVFLYILAAKLFTFHILTGNIGLIILICILISVCGFLLGYSIIKNALNRVVFYAIKAKRSDELKSTFVASVSHELKNPLAVIKTNLFNLMEGLLGKIEDEQKKVFQLLYSVVERMTRLINELLDLHKIEAGMIGLKRKFCSLPQILEGQIKELEWVLNKKQLKLAKEILSKDLFVWADEDRLQQVVNNLLSNAIKYTPEGGSITLRAYFIEEFVRLEFIDSAESIPQDKIEKIFDKFQRLDAAKEGTGLGLAITRDIVESHKGKIWVEPLIGKGNKFIVVLPCDLRSSKR
jgi:two-component system sensor histidine kinase VicK